MMNTQRLKQFGASILIVLSLFVSSFAACGCHSHPAAENHAASCHEMSGMADNAPVSDSAAAEKHLTNINSKCCCFAKISQPSALTNAEKIKTQQIAALPPVVVVRTVLANKTEIFRANFYFENHFYNSNYLERLTPPRAPPVS